MNVVFDANVVIAGAGWRREAHLCLVALGRRRLKAYATLELLEELRETAADLQARGEFRRHSPWAILDWYCDCVRLVEPAPLGKPRSRDLKDDPYLACALAAGAKCIISRDADLLGLGKPFGIEVLTPRQLLSQLNRPL